MEINFDPKDLEGMIKLMDEYGDTRYPFNGVNEDGEDTRISIAHDSIYVTTYQHNGWIRNNIYYRDGRSEELFEQGYEADI